MTSSKPLCSLFSSQLLDVADRVSTDLSVGCFDQQRRLEAEAAIRVIREAASRVFVLYYGLDS
jgi:hypothetical protein